MIEYIYVLLDSEGTIFYCGRTVNIRKRTNGHRRKLKMMFTLRVVDEVLAHQTGNLEQWWIKQLRDSGVQLRNISNGIRHNVKYNYF